jgi:hypothetical protein
MNIEIDMRRDAPTQAKSEMKADHYKHTTKSPTPQRTDWTKSFAAKDA